MGLRFLADQCVPTIEVNSFWWKSIESEFGNEQD